MEYVDRESDGWSSVPFLRAEVERLEAELEAALAPKPPEPKRKRRLHRA